jgi:acyl-CoA thioesterase
MTPDEIARHSTKAMWDEDHASRGLGMAIESSGPGRAVVSMTITQGMVNGHGTCHGGYIFTLADSAFAFACNSHGRRAVAQYCSIQFLAPGKLGMRLVAEAVERVTADRSGVTDVTVRDGEGGVIAEFRGHSRIVPGSLLPPT